MQEICGACGDLGESSTKFLVSFSHMNSFLLYGKKGMLFICFSLFQKETDPSLRDNVVLLLQDMLEVVTRDMMVNENRSVDSVFFPFLHFIWW